MIKIAALEPQRSMRELAGLPRICDELEWCSTEQLAIARNPAVVVGMWLYESPAESKKLLSARAASGLTTILVPRFKAGDLHSFIKAPSSVQLTIGEFNEFQWQDGTACAVPGQTIIKTKLHNGQWGGIAGLGSTVLGFREHEASGWIVICTAAVSSRQFGVEMHSQRALLEQIMSQTQDACSVTQSVQINELTTVSPVPAQQLLASDDTNAAAIVLAIAIGNGKRDMQSVSRSLSRIGFDVTDDAIEQTLAHLTVESVDAMESALKRYGWGAHLRRGRAVLANGGDE